MMFLFSRTSITTIVVVKMISKWKFHGAIFNSLKTKGATPYLLVHRRYTAMNMIGAIFYYWTYLPKFNVPSIPQ